MRNRNATHSNTTYGKTAEKETEIKNISYLATVLLCCPVDAGKMQNNLRAIDILQLSSKWHAIHELSACCFLL